MILDNDSIVKYLEGLDNEAKAFKEESLRFSWYMRGGLSYYDAMHLSAEERKIIRKIIEQNLDTTKESGLPFF